MSGTAKPPVRPPVSSTPDSVPPLFVIESCAPAPRGAELRVRLSDLALRRTSSIPSLAEEILCELPGIVRHRCECGSAHGIAAELADTETVHLFEHVTLEVLALGGFPRSMRGETSWEFKRDGRGVYRVLIGCEDVDAVRRAASEASELIEDVRSRA